MNDVFAQLDGFKADQGRSDALKEELRPIVEAGRIPTRSLKYTPEFVKQLTDVYGEDKAQKIIDEIHELKCQVKAVAGYLVKKHFPEVAQEMEDVASGAKPFMVTENMPHLSQDELPDRPGVIIGKGAKNEDVRQAEEPDEMFYSDMSLMAYAEFADKSFTDLRSVLMEADQTDKFIDSLPLHRDGSNLTALSGIRGNEDGQTILVTIDDLVKHPEIAPHLDMLLSKSFTLIDSELSHEKDDGNKLKALLEFDQNGTIKFADLFYNLEGDSEIEGAAEAIMAFKQVSLRLLGQFTHMEAHQEQFEGQTEYIKANLDTDSEVNMYGVTLANGTQVVFNDEYVMHGRSSYFLDKTVAEGGDDRWLRMQQMLTDKSPEEKAILHYQDEKACEEILPELPQKIVDIREKIAGIKGELESKSPPDVNLNGTSTVGRLEKINKSPKLQ